MFLDHASRVLVLTQSDKLRVPGAVSIRPIEEFNLSNHLRPQPSCRMSNYAEAMLRAWIIIAFRSDSFGMILDVPQLMRLEWRTLLRERLHQFLMGRSQQYSRFISSTKAWNQVLFHLAESAKL